MLGLGLKYIAKWLYLYFYLKNIQVLGLWLKYSRLYLDPTLVWKVCIFVSVRYQINSTTSKRMFIYLSYKSFYTCLNSPNFFLVGVYWDKIIQSITAKISKTFYFCLIHIKPELFNNQHARNNASKTSNNFRRVNLLKLLVLQHKILQG